MRKILNCRRTTVALVAIICLTGLATVNNVDVSGAIAMIVGFLCGANAAQGVFEKKN